MAIFTGTKSNAINSPRHLTLRHARKTIALKATAAVAPVSAPAATSVAILTHDEGPADDKNVDAGQEQVNSFWSPGLEAGASHHIAVKQTITQKIPNEPDVVLTLNASQAFDVDAPQYVLPKGSIYSVYPPSGYSDDHRILPHVVLTDPHLPWERPGDPGAGVHDTDRNRTPWLVLFAFAQDELRLDQDFLNTHFPSSDQLPPPVKQTPTMAVNMNVSDLLKMKTAGSIATPVVQPTPDVRTDFIFIKPDLFTSLFSTFDANNKRQVPAAPITSQYKYLSHVRKINTTGMAVAGVEDVGIFSVVISGRSGVLDNKLPATMSVHLVSIEGVTGMQFPVSQTYVSLCSLYSWNYTVNPPGMLNVHDAFVSLGATLDVLRPPEDMYSSLLANTAPPVQQRLGNRIKDGYSMVRYRAQTGEQTVAMLRGPFTPTLVAALDTQLSSNSGVDLQILDREVGIMDLTYCSAWQMGRTLALGSQAFTAALVRLRTSIRSIAMAAIQLKLLKQKSQTSIRTRTDVVSNLPRLATNLSLLHVAGKPSTNDVSGPFTPGGPLKRWSRPRLAASDIPELDAQAPAVVDDYLTEATAAARRLALSQDGVNIYDENEKSIPVSTDWMVVLGWVMDRMYLAGVPAHYLIIDPSHLEPERLKFFYIDPNWVDALIDGALSLGNHHGDDYDRIAIKAALNDFIKHKSLHLLHPPQIPTYGFLLRSDLVTMFPDLKVTTLPETPGHPDRAPLLRHEIVTDGVMMTLFDRLPVAGTPDQPSDFTGLVFTQPPHQQRFAAGYKIEYNDTVKAYQIGVDIHRQYTVVQAIRDTDAHQNDALLPTITMKPDDPDNIFVFGTTPTTLDLHFLRLPHFADVQLNMLQTKMPTYVDTGVTKKYFDDDTSTSALLALQLNDVFYSLTIDFSNPTTAAALANILPSDGSSTSAVPRTLKLMTPATVKKLFPRPGVASAQPSASPDHAALATTAAFKRLSSPSQAFTQANLAPNIRAPVVADTDRLLSPSPSRPMVQALAMAEPANFPKFTCQAYSLNQSYVQYSASPQDIVFQVLVTNNTQTLFELVEFDIRIQLGPSDNRLFAGYDGTGATMLSNLRFNVLIEFPKTQDYIQLRLLPRSEKGYINVGNISKTRADGSQDLSFVLALAQVNKYPKQVQLLATTFAKYHNMPNVVPDQFVINIINPTAASQ